MADVSLYDMSIPLLLSYLTNTSAVLKKGQLYAKEHSIPLSQLTEARLAPDMQPLPYQIQRLSDAAKGVAARVAGDPPVSMADDETTFEQLYTRIDKTIDVLKGVSRKSMEGKAQDEVMMKSPRGDFRFTGLTYLTDFVIPNFFFHVNMTYAILRMKGVPIGKMDYAGDTFTRGRVDPEPTA
ncbi:hypothetical protein ACLMJK_005208 [Lecanora helva]